MVIIWSMSREDNVLKDLESRGFSGRLRTGVPLSSFTTYGIGGPAQVLAEPSRAEDVEAVVDHACREGTRLFVMGGGSKILAPDDGVEGIVMLMGDLFSHVTVSGNELRAASGLSNPALAGAAADAGLAGLEWIFDIPGRVGGSLVQNAGMNECSISQNLVEATFFRSDCRLRTVAGRDLSFGYRTSSFKQWGDTVIVEALFRFDREADPVGIRKAMEEIKAKRHAKFPVGLPTCGSVFKRPEGHYPGRLIQDCGLGGRRIGGAEISTLHHNFIVNRGGARASDVRALVDLVTETVEKRFGVTLERELIYLEETLFRKP
jgi:UDP-N-acetylmuramate dehydrogenase